MKSIENHKFNNEPWVTFQKNVRRLTQVTPLSLTDLARELDMKYQTLYSITNRSNPNPTMETLIKLSNYFGVGIDDLVRGEVSQNINTKSSHVPLFRDFDLVDGVEEQNHSNFVWCDLSDKSVDAENSFCVLISDYSSHLFPADTILIIENTTGGNGTYLAINKSDSKFCVIKKHEICYDTYDIIGFVTSSVFDW